MQTREGCSAAGPQAWARFVSVWRCIGTYFGFFLIPGHNRKYGNTGKLKEAGKKITYDTRLQRISVRNILTYFLPGVFYTRIFVKLRSFGIYKFVSFPFLKMS